MNRIYSRTEKNFILFVFSVILGFLVVSTVFAILHWEDVKETKEMSDDIIIKECACSDKYHDEFYVVGVSGDNLTTVINVNDNQQMLLRKPKYYTSGGQVYVSKQNELWDINANFDINGNTIYIYETTTWKLRQRLKLPDYCAFGNYDISYHPEAGIEKRGQVWLSCDASEVWVVYDPASRMLLTKIELPLIYVPDYTLFEITVGENYAVASLTNTTDAVPGLLLQFSTENAMVTASRSIDPLPHLWYRGNKNSNLYVASQLTGEMYVLNYQTLMLEQTALNVGEPISLITDTEEMVVYLLNANSTDGTDSISAYYTRDITTSLPASPYTTPHGPPKDISINSDDSNVVVSYSSTGIVSKFPIDPHTGDVMQNSPIDINAGFSGYGSSVSIIKTVCPCSLCPFYSNSLSTGDVLLALA